MEKLKKKADRYISAGLLAFIGVVGYNTYQVEHADAEPSVSQESDISHYTYDGNVVAGNSKWSLHPNYVQMTKEAGQRFETYKTEYMLFNLENTAHVLASTSFSLHPVIMSAIPPIENGYGVDILAGSNNFHGMKAYEGDPCVMEDIPTHEQRGNVLKPENHDFLCFEEPYESFYAHAWDMNNLDHYKDYAVCASIEDYRPALRGLQNETQGPDCQITIPDKLAYATGNGYESTVEDVINTWNLENIWVYHG